MATATFPPDGAPSGEVRRASLAWDAGRFEALGPALVTAANAAGIGLAVVLIEPPEPRIVYMSDLGVETIGHPKESILNQPAITFLTPEEREVHKRGPEVAAEIPQDLRHFETTVLTAAGKRVPVEVSMAPLELEGQFIVVVFFRDISDRRQSIEALRQSEERFREKAILGFARDVTERKAMESQLVRSDRLAALGTLLAGIAHEMNNPLAYVLLGIEQAFAQLDQLETRVGDLGRLREVLSEVRQGATRVAAVVGQLRVTAGPDGPGPVDVGQALRGALRMAGNEIRHRARLATSMEDIPVIEGSAQQLEQVFLNLLVNATQALPEGRAGNEITVSLRESPVGVIVVEIKDNGQGIPPETLPRIFDPFFTTKAVGVGTGLGLSICHGIVTSHGGTIDVDSEAGRGTRFRVTLPVRREASGGPVSAPATPVKTMPGLGQRRRRVLVVDDEPALGAMIRRMLGDDFQVDVATNGLQGLAELGRADQTYDTVLCDIMMPGMTGMELYMTVSERHPGLAGRFVFMTGGAFTPRAVEFLANVGSPCLDKPFDLAALRAAVDRA